MSRRRARLDLLGRAAAPLVAALGAAAGCNVPLEASLGPATVNTCSATSDCGAGAACVQGECAATRYDLANLLLEVRPQAGSTFGSGTSYVIDPGAAGIPLVSTPGTSQPFRTRFDIHLSAPVSIHGGQVLLDPTTTPGKGCNFPDGSVPAQLTFYRSRVTPLAGLPVDQVQVSATASQSSSGATYTFDVKLVSDPNDRYDVYIEPQPQAAPGCSMVIPPYFVENQTIDATRTTWRLPPIRTLSGTITGLTDTASWRVNLVEPIHGLIISAGSQLLPGAAGATTTPQIAPIDSANPPIFRLTPVDATQPDPKPVDATRATGYWELEGAVLGGTATSPQVQIAVSDLTVSAIGVKGQILGSDAVTGIPAQLAFQSQLLQGPNASNAAFSADAVPTDSTGAFSIGMPPGNYAVRIFPTVDADLSITDSQINWPLNVSMPSCVCGMTFELDRRATVGGTVTTPDGRALGAATAGIAPSQTVARSYLAGTHLLPPLPARAETTTTDASGSFSLLADLGNVDLTIRPDPATNLPWLVLPQISPEPGASPSALVLASPAFLGGTLLDPQGNPVPNAQIDAWYPVRDAADPTALVGTVVKIATTSTDASGAYTLVLPSSVSSSGLK